MARKLQPVRFALMGIQESANVPHSCGHRYTYVHTAAIYSGSTASTTREEFKAMRNQPCPSCAAIRQLAYEQA